eukprot:Sspe_Gene.51149::Locus_28411_Transcript_1_1_Confidence_1.000_Length_2232::g.51149::m.51149/K11849/USP25; ubiquitin carboxyl-terminal hydrolase 25
MTFARLELSDKSYVNPGEVLRAMKGSTGRPFKIGEQEDCTEFNDLFLSTIESALSRSERGKEGLEDLKRLFQGRQRETYSVLDGGGVTKQKSDLFEAIVLAVDPQSKTIHDLLEAHTQEEVLSEYKYEMEVDGATTETVSKAKKSVWFDELPPVLVLQLQRASYDQGKVVKTNQHIECPEVLVMDGYMQGNSERVLPVRKQAEALKAKLRAAEEKLAAVSNFANTGKSFPELMDVLESTAADDAPLLADEDFVGTLKDALSRWRKTKEEHMEKLRQEIAALKGEIESAYAVLPQDVKYRLWGMLVHEGTMAAFGHYWVCLRNKEGNGWYRFNDKVVEEISLDDVLSSSCGGKGTAQASAYCIVYLRDGNNNVMEGPATPPAPLVQSIEAENQKFQEEIESWKENEKRFAMCLKKRKEDLQSESISSAKVKSIDNRIYSLASFAVFKQLRSDPVADHVMDILTVIDAYSECFKSNLLDDFNDRKGIRGRAESAIRVADIKLEVFYDSRQSVRSVIDGYHKCLRVVSCYKTALEQLLTFKDVLISEGDTAYQTSMAYINEALKLESWAVPKERINFTVACTICLLQESIVSRMKDKDGNFWHSSSPLEGVLRMMGSLLMKSTIPDPTKAAEIIATDVAPVVATNAPLLVMTIGDDIAKWVLQQLSSGKPPAIGTARTPPSGYTNLGTPDTAQKVAELEVSLYSVLEARHQPFLSCFGLDDEDLQQAMAVDG